MVESALEFLRIAESHDYREIILSMKSSNPKVMIEAYRLLVERMDAEDMHYPLHLGVTEAGDGEDGRIKGAIGIGSLLLDGLGDTIRVSLTEDSVYEIPVARAIADKAMSRWRGAGAPGAPETDSIDPYHFEPPRDGGAAAGGRRRGPRAAAAGHRPGRGRGPGGGSPQGAGVAEAQGDPGRGPACPDRRRGRPGSPQARPRRRGGPFNFLVLELGAAISPSDLGAFLAAAGLPRRPPAALRRRRRGRAPGMGGPRPGTGHFLAVDASPADFAGLAGDLAALGDDRLIAHLLGAAPRAPTIPSAPTAGSRRPATAGSRAPVWIRNTAGTAVRGDNSFLSKLIEASFLTGSLLCDGVGDLVSIETEADPRARRGSRTTSSRAPARGFPRRSLSRARAAGGRSSTCRRRRSASARRPRT
jgi:(E)-4-hydroxy-3-methylbut-2-enyl-diphosphate synthase